MHTRLGHRVFVAMLLAGGWSRETSADVAADSVVTVLAHVTDYAHVPQRQLTEAQAHATAIYRAAGLDVVWSSAAWAPTESPRSPHTGIIDIRVVILTLEMAEALCRARDLGDSVLGQAASQATDAAGRIAYMFYHRIYRAAAAHGASVQRGLGHVMAHEIGHVLLGMNSHSADGLMRAQWEPWNSRLQTFTPGQVLRIRRRFASSTVRQ